MAGSVAQVLSWPLPPSPSPTFQFITTQLPSTTSFCKCGRCLLSDKLSNVEQGRLRVAKAPQETTLLLYIHPSLMTWLVPTPERLSLTYRLLSATWWQRASGEGTSFSQRVTKIQQLL